MICDRWVTVLKPGILTFEISSCIISMLNMFINRDGYIQQMEVFDGCPKRPFSSQEEFEI